VIHSLTVFLYEYSFVIITLDVDAVQQDAHYDNAGFPRFALYVSWRPAGNALSDVSDNGRVITM